MIHARTLCALLLLVAPALAQDGPGDRIKTLNSAAEAQRAVPEDLRDEAWGERHFRTLYHLGVDLAAHETEGSEYFRERAIQVLEELYFAAGDGTEMALHAYTALGDIYAAKGDWKQAAGYYRAVVVELLGDEGSEPVRLTTVPEPDLEQAPEEVQDLPQDPEPFEQPLETSPTPGEEVPRVSDLEVRAADSLARWRLALDEQARAAHADELEQLARESLRAGLVLGDLRAEQGDHRAAARQYAEVIRRLTGEAPARSGPGD